MAEQTAEQAAAQTVGSDVAGGGRVGYRDVTPDEARGAARRGWDAYAEEYQAEHGAFLGDATFTWCPEGLDEADVAMLGPVETLRGRRVLEVGCGAAQAARWLRRQGVDAVGVDLSGAMLAHARLLDARTGTPVPVVQADAAALPLADGTADAAFSAFGALPFVADVGAVHREVARVLRPGAPWVFAVNHPVRWIFPDDPDPAALRVVRSYFDRRAYVEADEAGRPDYVETHRTVGDHVRSVLAAGFGVEDLVEPEWPTDHVRPWGQWSPERGRLVPGTLVIRSRRV